MSEIRNIKEVIERKTLASYAQLSAESKGREIFEAPCPMRTIYQRDRDRIIHSNSFRRLMHKTQVFLSPEGDHYRTRLTHTLEVSQIARTIANALRVNEDLTEAVALGHDLGHTPFGHAGESVLNKLLPNGFRHYEHSVRVAQVLEKNGRGLNLSFEVIDGIYNHTKGPQASTVEGRIVRYADRIAYINHDIDDAITALVLKNEHIPKHIRQTLGETKTQRITTLINSLVENSENGNLKMEKQIEDCYEELHEFMYDKVYLNPYAKTEEKKIPRVITSLYEYFLNIDNLPDDMKIIAERDGIEVAAGDYIAGMTDRYATYYYEKLYVPKSWNIGM